MWLYNQKTGILSNGELWFQCYAGHGDGKNNPELDHMKDVGPLPRGRYTMSSLTVRMTARGPYVIHLMPHPENEMHGRAGFLIHGDSVKYPGTASLGCIIRSPKSDREKIWTHGDRELLVVGQANTPHCHL